MKIARKPTSNSLLVAALEAVFPNYCFLCGLRSYREQPLCTACQAGLTANGNCCAACALPIARLLPDWTDHTALCGQCLQSPPGFDRVIAPWIYDEKMAFLLHRWKFHGEHRLASLLAYLWLNQLHGKVALPDIIVPTPLHWSKRWRRGFNQSELLTVELRRQCTAMRETPMDTQLLLRHRATSAQSGLAAAQRMANMRGAFTARRRCDNLRVAIVDDVLTTGATAAAMATTLRDAGASTIDIWCIARTPEPQF
jgi:ComF family protein